MTIRTGLKVAGLTLSAMAMTAGTAAADAADKGLTVLNSNASFNAGQTYKVSFTAPTAGSTVVCGDQATDSTGGKTNTIIGTKIGAPAGVQQFSWSPTVVGYHVLICTAADLATAKSVTFGPVTVNVLAPGAGLPGTGSSGS